MGALREQRLRNAASHERRKAIGAAGWKRRDDISRTCGCAAEHQSRRGASGTLCRHPTASFLLLLLLMVIARRIGWQSFGHCSRCLFPISFASRLRLPFLLQRGRRAG